jgi:16S rRNA (cytosine967-C5)-methyltransferase
MPFHLYLKEKFKENKNWGSKDRKRYRACCYHFWRNAVGVSRNTATEILEYLQHHFPAPDHNITENHPADIGSEPNPSSIQTLETQANPQPYAKFDGYLSSHLTPQILTPWFQNEPCVWIRPLNNKQPQVVKWLQQQQIEILYQHESAVAVSAQADLQPITQKGIAYIQDIGSQMAMDWRDLPLQALCSGDHRLWDSCAGSGGKSITLLQNCERVIVQCSDVRQNILENLQKRFQSLRLSPPKTQVINLTQEKSAQTYHIVMADVPCSGSGTWRRNPENLHFFTLPEIALYAQKQQQILENLSSAVISGGYLVYLTCSVFKAENEENITHFLGQHTNFTLVEQRFCGGIENHGDYIYRAILQKIG